MNDPFEKWDARVYVHSPHAGYIVMIGANHIELCQMVANQLRGGWVPQGGLCVSGQPGEMGYYQAMYHPNWMHP